VTADFLDYLKKNLLDTHPDLAGGINVDEWINKPGIPAGAPRARSEAFERIDAQAKGWLGGKVRLEQLPVKAGARRSGCISYARCPRIWTAGGWPSWMARST
jgi:hypothetical protein